VQVAPYDLLKARDCLADRLAATENVCFNLTGGTKPMALAAYALAVERDAPFVYFQTEGERGRDLQSVLYHYGFQGQTPILQRRETLRADLLTLDEYLCAHWEHGYAEAGASADEGGNFERAVAQALTGSVDELKAGVKPQGFEDQVEIDLVVRCGNQVGLIEVKTGGQDSGKHAVDQLTTAAARELSGTYTARFLVTGGEKRSEYKAVAKEVDVEVIELWGYRGGRLDPNSATNLRQRLAARLPCRKGI
jgi:Holliday junction resolvase-like predicted endonuclease